MIIIYTDGGCSPNPGLGGWAAVLISLSHDNYIKEISGAENNTTNNRMELTAALMALKELKNPSTVEIYTDSQYLKKAFTDGWLSNWQKNGWRTKSRTSVANVDLWKELLTVSSIHSVQWKWVKGHSDNQHNERCDELVKHARDSFKV